MSKHSKPRSRQQRRQLRLLAAFGITGALLAIPAATVGATYMPDVLNLGPDVGHRFDDEVVHSPADDGLEVEVVPDDYWEDDMEWLSPLDVDTDIWVDEDGTPLGWSYPGSGASRLGPPDPDGLVMPGRWPATEDWDM